MPKLPSMASCKRLAIAVVLDAVSDIVEPKKDTNARAAIVFLTSPEKLHIWADILGQDADELAAKFGIAYYKKTLSVPSGPPPVRKSYRQEIHDGKCYWGDIYTL